jgi:hypothetical protein
LTGHVFHRHRGGEFRTRFLRSGVSAEVEQIVDRVPQILFAAEIAFRRLDRGMAQQKLDLLQLATTAVAQLRTRPPQVVRRNML